MYSFGVKERKRAELEAGELISSCLRCLSCLCHRRCRRCVDRLQLLDCPRHQGFSVGMRVYTSQSCSRSLTRWGTKQCLLCVMYACTYTRLYQMLHTTFCSLAAIFELLRRRQSMTIRQGLSCLIWFTQLVVLQFVFVVLLCLEITWASVQREYL